MKTPASTKTAPASLRWAGYFLALLLTLLLIWLLGFLLSDIGRIQGPVRQDVIDRYVEKALVDRQASLAKNIKEIDLQIKRQGEIQQNLRRSMDNARQTMEEMMNLHRLSLEQKLTPSDTEREALATSQTRFLDAQNKFETANTEITTLTQDRYQLSQELKSVDEQIKQQKEPAYKEYDLLRRKHEFKLASFKLLVILPLFLSSAWLVYRYRGTPFRPVYFSALIATFWRVGDVMFDHFPRDFFKYIAICAAIGIVLWFLCWVLLKVARPGTDTLLKRYREAYRNHHCPICAFPIARGSFKHAVWTRKGPIFRSGEAGETPPDETPYSCPACGAVLFEPCPQCQKPRHSLLPYCESCGDKKPVG